MLLRAHHAIIITTTLLAIGRVLTQSAMETACAAATACFYFDGHAHFFDYAAAGYDQHQLYCQR